MTTMAQEKMNVTLAKAEHERAIYSESLRRQGEFFKRNSSSFRGEKKTFHAAEGQLEDPTKIGHTVVAATVSEELKRLMDPADNAFSENASSLNARLEVLFPDGTAEHYKIQGYNGYPRRIQLDPLLVTWE